MGCISTVEQSWLSITKLVERGGSAMQVIRTLAINKATAKHEHAMRMSLTEYSYEIRGDKLYSPTFKMYFDELLDPPADRRAKGYPVMPPHVVENLREAQRLLTSGKVGALVILSPAIDFSQEHSCKGQVYRMRVVGNQVLVTATDHSADPDQMRKEAGKLYGLDTSKMLAGNEINGGGVCHTDRTDTPTRQEVTDIVRKFGNEALAKQYEAAVLLAKEDSPENYVNNLIAQAEQEILEELAKMGILPTDNPAAAIREGFLLVERELQKIKANELKQTFEETNDKGTARPDRQLPIDELEKYERAFEEATAREQRKTTNHVISESARAQVYPTREDISAAEFIARVREVLDTSVTDSSPKYQTPHVITSNPIDPVRFETDGLYRFMSVARSQVAAEVVSILGQAVSVIGASETLLSKAFQYSFGTAPEGASSASQAKTSAVPSSSLFRSDAPSTFQKETTWTSSYSSAPEASPKASLTQTNKFEATPMHFVEPQRTAVANSQSVPQQEHKINRAANTSIETEIPILAARRNHTAMHNLTMSWSSSGISSGIAKQHFADQPQRRILENTRVILQEIRQKLTSIAERIKNLLPKNPYFQRKLYPTSIATTELKILLRREFLLRPLQEIKKMLGRTKEAVIRALDLKQKPNSQVIARLNRVQERFTKVKIVFKSLLRLEKFGHQKVSLNLRLRNAVEKIAQLKAKLIVLQKKIQQLEQKNTNKRLPARIFARLQINLLRRQVTKHAKQLALHVTKLKNLKAAKAKRALAKGNDNARRESNSQKRNRKSYPPLSRVVQSSNSSNNKRLTAQSSHNFVKLPALVKRALLLLKANIEMRAPSFTKRKQLKRIEQLYFTLQEKERLTLNVIKELLELMRVELKLKNAKGKFLSAQKRHALIHSEKRSERPEKLSSKSLYAADEPTRVSKQRVVINSKTGRAITGEAFSPSKSLDIFQAKEDDATKNQYWQPVEENPANFLQEIDPR